MASLQQNTVFKYWHENPGGEIYTQHTPNINSSASAGPSVSPSRSRHWSPSGTNPGHYPFAMGIQAYIETSRKKKNPTVTKQVIIFHLVTKYFTDGAAITCGEREQSILSLWIAWANHHWMVGNFPFSEHTTYSSLISSTISIMCLCCRAGNRANALGRRRDISGVAQLSLKHQMPCSLWEKSCVIWLF